MAGVAPAHRRTSKATPRLPRTASQSFSQSAAARKVRPCRGAELPGVGNGEAAS